MNKFSGEAHNAIENKKRIDYIALTLSSVPVKWTVKFGSNLKVNFELQFLEINTFRISGYLFKQLIKCPIKALHNVVRYLQNFKYSYESIPWDLLARKDPSRKIQLVLQVLFLSMHLLQ